MNEATLERLLLDAALGGLSGDVEELLVAHVSSDPAKMREAEELKSLVGRAKEAMREDCPAEPDLRGMKQRWRMRQAVVWGGRVAAMAACVLVGVFIAKVQSPPVQNQVVVQPPIPQVQVAINDSRPAAEGELWSAQRIYRNALEANRNEKQTRPVIRSFQ
jgi:hypothetical protein